MQVNLTRSLATDSRTPVPGYAGTLRSIGGSAQNHGFGEEADLLEDCRDGGNSHCLLPDDGPLDSAPFSSPRAYIPGFEGAGKTRQLSTHKGSGTDPGIVSDCRASQLSRIAPWRRDGYVAEDIVIRHQKRAVNVAGKPDLPLTSGRGMGVIAADTVVQYGSDVTMWSRKHGAILNRLGH